MAMGDKSRRRQLGATAARHLMDTWRTTRSDFQCFFLFMILKNFPMSGNRSYRNFNPEEAA